MPCCFVENAQEFDVAVTKAVVHAPVAEPAEPHNVTFACGRDTHLSRTSSSRASHAHSVSEGETGEFKEQRLAAIAVDDWQEPETRNYASSLAIDRGTKPNKPTKQKTNKINEHEQQQKAKPC